MKIREMRALVRSVALGCFLLVPFSACDSGRDTDDSETHFLTYCNGKCPGGFECLCGVCTKTCSDTSGCPVVPGAVCRAECAASSENVCDVECQADGDCRALGERFACQSGRCREGGGAVDAGSGGGSGTLDAAAGGSRADASSAGDPGDAAGGRDASKGAGGSTADASGNPEAGVRPACKVDPDPTPTVPALGEIDPDVIARAAAVVASCWPNDGVSRVLNDFWTVNSSPSATYIRAAEQLACLAGAACGCGATERCLGLDFQFDATASCTPSCEGSVYTTCTSVARFTIDCATIGQECDPTAGCVDTTSEACDFSTYVPNCTADGRAAACFNSRVYVGPVCASMGLTCVDGACTGPGTACDVGESGGMGCSPDGTTLDVCANGHRGTLDCSTQGPGFRCQDVGGYTFCGLGAECVPYKRPLESVSLDQRCEGDTLVFCNQGRLERVDCPSLGFVGCDLDASQVRYGCVDALGCGNKVVDPGEQCDDGNDDRFDGCAYCRWSCIDDKQCNGLGGEDECMTYTCQPDHSCAKGVPKPDDTSCYKETGVSFFSGTCQAGVCTPPATCGAVTCVDPDDNACNGTPACTSAPDAKGHCVDVAPPLAPGTRCTNSAAPTRVCNVDGACVASRCGNGVVDADLGEECEPPSQGVCNRNCQIP